MWPIALIYGSVAGLIVIGSMLAGFAFAGSGSVLTSEWLGYLLMIVALSLVFFGIKRYRDRELGGVIGFLPAFGLGLLITATASLAYVVVWEIYLAATGYTFISDYTAALAERMHGEGMSEAEIATETENLQKLEENYANPFFRVVVTLFEIFPVGFVVALASAALLRNPRLLPART